MSEAERFFLERVVEIGEAVDIFHDGGKFFFAALSQQRDELVRGLKVAADALFALPGDKDDLRTAGGYGLVDAVMDERPVDERHHLLRDVLRRGEEARAKSRNGENRLFYRAICLISHGSPPPFLSPPP